MPVIPLILPPFQGAEELGASQTSVELIDGHIDDFNTLRTRGGLIRWASLDVPCSGVYWWRERGFFLAVFGEYLYRVAPDLSLVMLNGSTTRLHATGKATFASNEYWLYVANGERILAWDGTNPPAFASSPAPDPCSHVAYIDGYILGNKTGTRSWYYAEPDPGDASAIHVWAATGLTKEGGPDLLQAIRAAWREVLLVGDRTSEVWFDQGGPTVFARLEGAFIEMGTPAPHSIVNADNTWIWLNQFRQVVRLEGRTPRVISAQIELPLRGLTSVSDAVATLMDGKYILSFPTDDITWVYDLRRQFWSRWGEWREELNDWGRWIGQVSAHVDAFGIDIVGGKRGNLYLYHPVVVSDDGAVIRCRYRSQHFNHGTYKPKVSHVVFNIKRGSDRAANPQFSGGLSDLLSLGPIALPDATRCSAYASTLPVVEGATIISVSGLPSGLAFNGATQEISGTPATTGDFVLTVVYRLSSGLTVPVSAPIHVANSTFSILLPGE